MPIRTNRGRAAVYRRLWGWPMRSPRHLVFTLVLVGVAVIVVGRLLPEGEAPARAGGDRVETSVVVPTTTERVTEDAAGATTDPGSPADASSWEQAAPPDIELTESEPPPPPQEEAVETARQWGAAWVAFEDGGDVAAWLETLAPHTTEERFAVMSSVDPHNIPASEITGEPEVVDADETSMIVTLATDAQPLELTLIVREGQWRVSAYEQESV